MTETLIPILLAAVVFGVVLVGAMFVVRKDTSNRQLVWIAGGAWLVFLIVAALSLIFPSSTRSVVLLGGALVIGIVMYVYIRSAGPGSPDQPLVNRPQFWAVVVGGTAISFLLLATTNT